MVISHSYVKLPEGNSRGYLDLLVIRGSSAGGCRQRSFVGSSPIGADGCGRGCGGLRASGWEDTTGDGILGLGCCLQFTLR